MSGKLEEKILNIRININLIYSTLILKNKYYFRHFFSYNMILIHCNSL